MPGTKQALNNSFASGRKDDADDRDIREYEGATRIDNHCASYEPGVFYDVLQVHSLMRPGI